MGAQVSTQVPLGMSIALRLEWKYHGGSALCEQDDFRRPKRKKAGR